MPTVLGNLSIDTIKSFGIVFIGLIQLRLGSFQSLVLLDTAINRGRIKPKYPVEVFGRCDTVLTRYCIIANITLELSLVCRQIFKMGIKILYSKFQIFAII